MDTCIGNCVGCLKVNYSLFSDLSENELEILNRDRQKLFFKKGDIIFLEGVQPKGLFCLNHGKVKLVKKGRIEEEFIVSLHKPVDFLGFDNLMSGKAYMSSAIALEDLSICVIKKENLFKVIDQVPELGAKIIKHLSGKLIEQNERMLVLTQTKMESRLAFTLLDLINFFGYESDGKTIAVELKRKELASLASMNTANVIRILSTFTKQKMIKTKLRRIQVVDLYALKQLVA